MNKHNIFWILIDSARNYQSDEDDRGLPQSVVDFAKKNIHYKNVVTSAPSTIQSISSMMTSTPSYLLSRSYDNYRGNDKSLIYLPHLLKNNGFDIFGAIYFKHGREVMSHVFDLIDPKHFPKSLNHGKDIWNNKDVYRLFEKFSANHNWIKPTMTYLHYNVRVDSNISNIIDDTLRKISDLGLMDNSIIIINSDHGYPSKSRNWNADKAKVEGWGHDQQLYNDNILTPLVLKYPNCRNFQSDEFISTLDIAPTICDILGIDIPSNFYGVTLKNKEKIKPRLLRTDNRYIGQLPAYTSYIFEQKKCIIYKNNDNESYEYFELDKDPNELFPLSFNESFQHLRNEIRKNNNEYYNYHYDLLFKKWSKIKLAVPLDLIQNIYVSQVSSPAFNKLTIKVIKAIFKDSNIYHSSENTDSYEMKEFDLIIGIIESELPWDLNKITTKMRFLKGTHLVYLDNNGEIYYNAIKLRVLYKFFQNRFVLFKKDFWVLYDLIKRIVDKKILRPVK